VDTKKIDKRANVYSQSVTNQILYVSVGFWFALVLEALGWDEFERNEGFETKRRLISGALAFGTLWTWYGVYGVLFDGASKEVAVATKVAKLFRKSTTKAFMSRCKSESRMFSVQLAEKEGGGTEVSSDIVLDMLDHCGLAAFWIARETL